VIICAFVDPATPDDQTFNLGDDALSFSIGVMTINPDSASD